MPHHKGIHHISVLAGDPQLNAEFYVKTLGMRMVKKSVNQDDPGTYHLFYGNQSATPGSSLTFFPWPRAHKGKPGTGESVNVSFMVPQKAESFWIKRLEDNGVEHSGVFELFGSPALRFHDPDGLELDMVFNTHAKTVDEHYKSTVPAGFAIQGFWATRLKLSEPQATIDVLSELLGFKKTAQQKNLSLYQTDAPVGNSVIIETAVEEPGKGGRGIIHQVAFRAEDEQELGELRKAVLNMGLHPTEIIDRHWFRSVYFREPGGVLFEIATDGPGYSVDEDPVRLGEQLILPPWLEPRRKLIEKILPEITV